MGVPLQVVIGTDLVAASGTKLVATIRHSQARQVDWRTVARLASGSLPAALIAGLLPVDGSSLRRFLAVALILTAIAQIWQPKSSAPRFVTALPLPLVGVLVGAMVGITSVGSGALTALYLRWAQPQLPLARLAGTDVVHGLFLTGVAAMAHASRAAVDWRIALLVLCGSVPAAWIGASLVSRLGQKASRSLLGGVLFVSGCLLLLR